jgi:hypothetical protein
MSKLEMWIGSILVMIVVAAPVLAGTDDGVPANDANPTNSSAAAAPAAPANLNPTPAVANGNVTALLGVLVIKGVLAPEEAKSIQSAPPGTEFQALLEALSRKGLVNASDLSALSAPATAQPASAAAPVSASLASPDPTPDPQYGKEKKPATPTVIPAVAPVRVLPVDPPVKGGLVPAFKLGPVGMTPYGFIKATLAHDSSDPRGDDFIVPGFLNPDTGPNTNPEFHLKARSTRFGANLEWPDISKNLTLTGRIEGDLEGNFSRVDNRNVSTIRSNAPQLRLAYVRLDYAAGEKTDLFFEGGQDWTIFGSTALPNLLETTFLGAYWGDTYERSPQMRVGFVQKLGGSRNFKFSPEFAVMMPSEGNAPADATLCTIPASFVPGTATAVTCSVTNGLGNQLGYGERQGADSGRPELEQRAVLQWQLDTAPGVAPAQLIFSSFEARREAVVLASAIAAPAGSDAAVIANYDLAKAAFKTGATDSSNGYGLQVAAQLPTRWFTVVASAYRGADLRFMFAGQLLSNFNDASGLTNTVTAPSVDRSSTVVFGTNAAGQEVVAPQRAVRGYGGFVNLGLPLSRWFKADPAGHNAGWTLYLHSGIDAVNRLDFARAKDIGKDGAGPYKSRLHAVSLFYKLNNWCTFAYEESLYSSYALPNDAGVFTANTSVAGVPSRTWRDLREEFGPIFTF